MATEYKVGDIVRYVGKDEEDLPFNHGGSIKLVEEDSDGFVAIAIGGDPADGVGVYLDEIADLEEEELEAAQEEAESAESGDRSAYDEAKEENAKQQSNKRLKVKAATKKKASTKKVAKKKATAKKKTATKKATTKKATTKKKAAETVESDEDSKELVLTSSVQKALKGKSAVNAARALVREAQVNDFNLGGVLCKIERDRDYLNVEDPETGEYFQDTKGPNGGFARFVELDLGIKYGKARYLQRFYETFAGLEGIDEVKLAAAGYSKTKEILDVVEANPDQANDWLEKATTEKLVDLQSQLKCARKDLGIERKPRGTNGSSSSKMTTVKFKVFNDQASVIEDAIQKAITQIGSKEGETDDERNQRAIIHIFSDWFEVQD